MRQLHINMTGIKHKEKTEEWIKTIQTHTKQEQNTSSQKHKLCYHSLLF